MDGHPKFRSQELGFDQLALGRAEAPQTNPSSPLRFPHSVLSTAGTKGAIHGAPVQGKGVLSVAASHRPATAEKWAGDVLLSAWFGSTGSHVRGESAKAKGHFLWSELGAWRQSLDRGSVCLEKVWPTKEEKAPICEETGCQDSPRREQ